MATKTLFLSDSSQITTVSPIPNITGVSFFSHLHPPTRQHYSKWTVTLTSSFANPPSLSTDVITITDATTSDGLPHPDPVFVLYATLSWYFHLNTPTNPPLTLGASRNEWAVIIDRSGLFAREEALAAAEQAGLILLFESATPDGGLVPKALKRAFWQISYPFMKMPSPVVYTISPPAVRHPIRPRPARNLYRRHVPALNAILTFRLAKLEDAPLVNKWMNTPRVAAFWNEAGPVTKTAEFLRKNLEMRHSFPVIGSWEDEPFGYFEVYWVKEDILGRYCEAQEWERGLHVLVGEERFRGSQRVAGWLGGLCHYIFCDDPRTQRISLEPRVDNEKFIQYLQKEGFAKEKEITFPHKQSALMRLTREAWDGPSV
ncbi:acyl-CoA N-acyltransferase [Sphaerosporella brunnea]|uniref:Acyl-CoA N-acyltransferase n=1 Tax=Sphaerosporella brunnea TaxID=1250544 RepID=A0A5J5EFU1_9PEZI|nr:acyl-CoA N-acyltransferase [Sphaerosporella brunnea]KAA8893859.1 acyl-CoA N-acyltransferase [Sphaerosporella brunnea]